MAMAFVFINTEMGSESAVLRTLQKIEGVDEAYLVYGVYDIVAKVNAVSTDHIKEIVTRHIRRIDKVRTTLTMMVAE